MKTPTAIALAFVGMAAMPALAFADSGKLYPSLPKAPTITIGQSGNILVRGATVSAVNDTSVIATTAWGNHTNSWTIQTDADTKYIDASGDTAARSSFSLGSLISFTGTLIGQGTVDANVIRNWSVPETRPVSFVGSVHGTTGSTLTMKRGNATTTILVTSSTTITNDGQAVQLSSITTDTKVKVKGTLNASTNTITASSIEVKDGEKEGKEDRTYKGPMVNFWHNLKARF
jgi:hypothetical protein